ncbi:MAG: tRNA dihydrouridine(20/20a) synthase DusA [Gammaproteobacteria bacterium]
MTVLHNPIAIAPMMDWTVVHFRQFVRCLSKHVLLYTEMLTCNAVIHGDRERLLIFPAEQHPIAIQLGGSDPQACALAAIIAESCGYDEINLNIGCPSERVKSGGFGACLMLEPDLVAQCIAAMKNVVSIPVTVKTRIGVDKQDHYNFLKNFVRTVVEAGCDKLIVHARKAWLKGLSPKENRTIPPLNYETVAQVKKDFPTLPVVLNGGIRTLESVREHLKVFDGVMLGRAAYENPYLLAEVDQLFYHDNDEGIVHRESVLKRFQPYLEAQLEKGIPRHRIMRHLMGLYHGEPYAKQWRRQCSA